MNNLTIGEILKATKGKIIHGNEAEEVADFSKDTRTIKSGALYVGIKGEKFDGNNYFKQAYENGAIACILDSKELNSEDLEKYQNVILVDDSIKALQDLARYRRNQYNIPVVAVTGSVGKTSTKDIIASVLSEKFDVLKTEGNNNNHIGLPLTLLKLKKHNAVVVEMGMNHFGEISLLTNIAKPNICIITNIGTSHIGNLGSRENILKAKLEILEGMPNNGTVIINNDNDLLHQWYEDNKNVYNIVTYGITNKSKFMANNIKIAENDSCFNMIYNEKEYSIKVPVPGIPFIYNSLCAVSVGSLLNIEMEKMIQGILKFELTKKRMEKLKTSNGVIIINDSYNASLDSVKPALEQLKNTTGNKKIAVLGDMLELGSYAKKLHELVGEEVIKNNIDILITVGDNARYIANKSVEMGMKEVFSYNSIAEAVKKIEEVQNENDVILLKASNSMHFNKIAEELIKK